MIVPIKWLKEFVDVKDAAEASEILLKAGFESTVNSAEENFKGVVAAQVLKASDIPGTHLKNCLVSDGRELCSVVCGAPNVDKGQLVAFARVGAVLPGGVTIAKRKIRGVLSHGMIVSEKELGVGEDASGILVLKENLPLGTPVSFKKEEVLDVEITADRGDCLSIYGIAREISLFSGKELITPEFPEITTEGEGPDFKVIREDENCPLYTGCLIEGVEIKPSPAWLKNKISAVGLNPQNNVVDITNLILFEFGQPLHAFDASRITSGTVRISPSAKGEKIKLLDGTDYPLEEGICLIRNGNEPIAAGGIMGGKASGISRDTRSVFLESAYFLPASIYSSSRKMNVSTPSSMRFARGIDGMMIKKALARAASLIKETAGGRVRAVFKEGKLPGRAPVAADAGRISALLGRHISPSGLSDSLSRLGDVKPGEGSEVSFMPYSWRNDLNIEEDLAEEVARRIGYDNIQPRYPRIRRMPYGLPDAIKHRSAVAGALVSAGFTEVITSDMIPEGKLLQKYPDIVKIKNPVSADMAVMRPTLLPGLADVLRRNVARGVSDIRIFELGKIFAPSKNGVREDGVIAGIATGRLIPLSHYNCSRADFFYVKGIMESILGSSTQEGPVSERAPHPFLRNSFVFKIPGESGKASSVFLVGELPQDILNSFDIKKDYVTPPVVYFELYYGSFYFPSRKKSYSAPPAVPSVNRDLSIVIDDGVKFGAVLSAINSARPKYLYDVKLLDVYRGGQVEKGKKSISLRLSFRGEGTLLQTDVDTQIKAVLNSLSSGLKAVLREK